MTKMKDAARCTLVNNMKWKQC